VQFQFERHNSIHGISRSRCQFNFRMLALICPEVGGRFQLSEQGFAETVMAEPTQLLTVQG